jgi:hypothetical protein
MHDAPSGFQPQTDPETDKWLDPYFHDHEKHLQFLH